MKSPDTSCMKQPIIDSEERADECIRAIETSARQCLTRVCEFGASKDALSALWQMKVEPVGFDPLSTDRPLNLIEQLNQTFTYIASLRAAKLLLSLHPEVGPLRLNLGTVGGSDIESEKEGLLAAEVFAAVNTSNNRKLANDVKKVSKTDAQLKYVFFMCPNIPAGEQPQRARGSGVRVWAVDPSL